MSLRSIALAIVLAVPAALLALASHAGSAPPQTPENPDMVKVHVFNSKGELIGPVAMPRLQLSDKEWQARLTPEQYRILRNDGTEPAFCGTLLDNKKEGVYACVGCGLPLFSSDSKFNSGTGWPSFFQPIAKTNVVETIDRSHGMVRTEITCARCDGHLGHVFPDGPRPTGLRFCLNSESLAFTENSDLASLGELETAVFAGGCFWCVEAVFEELEGVYEVVSGYTGGSGPAEYKAVTTGTTGHAEAVEIFYDPRKLDYATLLQVHFATHDPTTLNRQGADIGPQYRSAIFYANEEQRQLAEAMIADLNESGVFNRPIVTTLEPLKKFHIAEAYHQD
ncbi:MAG: bifunctional methionine sulfoxide reductase B/A protein, partial [Phycisphaerales bacterium JB037]